MDANGVQLPDFETVSEWSCQDVTTWLESVSLQECVEPFKRRNIDGKAFLEIYQETFLNWSGEIRLTHQRQIAKYLNECRSKDGSLATTKQGFRLNLRRTSVTPPPIPKQDYLGDANDEDVDSDEGWDTEFEDEPDDDASEVQKDNSDGDSGATNEISNLEPGESESENNGNQVADAIRKLNTGAFNNNNNNQGIRSRLSHSCSDLQENLNPSQPKKRSIPRPPDHPVVPRKPIFANSRSTEHLTHRLSVGRPQQQPPPPPSSKPHIILREETVFQKQQHVEEMDDSYEIPNSVGSQRSSTSSLSINLHLDTSGTIEEEYESLNSNVGDADSVIGEDYEVVGESTLPRMTGASANKPSLPPRAPLLPNKPKTKEPLKPPLPIRISKSQDDGGLLPRGKGRPTLGSCKNVISNLTSNLTLMFSDSRNRKQGDGASPSTEVSQIDKREDLKTSPIIEENCSETVRYVRRNEDPPALAQRPLPPPPPKKEAPCTQQNLIDSFPWFHRVERDEAEELLNALGKSGSYLVRESRRGGESNPYTLTIFNGARVSHLNIRTRPDGTFALGTEKNNEKTFCSVEELISFHQKEAILLTSKGQQTGKVRLIFHPDPR